MKHILRHLSAFIAPIVMGFVLPYGIVLYEQRASGNPFTAQSPGLRMVGSALCILGLALFYLTVRTFILTGRGTIMPWNPTQKLVVAGVYRHVRNPMILSLLILQTGEAVLFASYGIALLACLFFVINTIYFIYSEEPGLEKRFGAEYLQYKQHVPRWLPRLKPWQP